MPGGSRRRHSLAGAKSALGASSPQARNLPQSAMLDAVLRTADIFGTTSEEPVLRYSPDPARSPSGSARDWPRLLPWHAAFVGTHQPREEYHDKVAEASDNLMHTKTFEDDDRERFEDPE